MVIGLVAYLHAETVVFQIKVEIRQDQILLDEVPDDACHFIAVEFKDGLLYLDFGYDWALCNFAGS